MVSFNEGGGKHPNFKDRPPIEPQVRFISFSADASKMATVDVRPDIDHPSESYHSTLRFWERRPSGVPAEDSSLYSVQIEYDQPHRYSLLVGSKACPAQACQGLASLYLFIDALVLIISAVHLVMCLFIHKNNPQICSTLHALRYASLMKQGEVSGCVTCSSSSSTCSNPIGCRALL